MSNYESFIEKLINETDSDEISWKAINISFHEDVILNARFCTKVFETCIKKRTLVAVEKKVPVFHHELEEYFDRFDFELLLLNNNQLEKLIDESEVSRELLIQLIEKIAQKVFSTEKFIDSFLEK